jgi:hypothetical protein
MGKWIKGRQAYMYVVFMLRKLIEVTPALEFDSLPIIMLALVLKNTSQIFFLAT